MKYEMRHRSVIASFLIIWVVNLDCSVNKAWKLQFSCNLGLAGIKTHRVNFQEAVSQWALGGFSVNLFVTSHLTWTRPSHFPKQFTHLPTTRLTHSYIELDKHEATDPDNHTQKLSHTCFNYHSVFLMLFKGNNLFFCSLKNAFLENYSLFDENYYYLHYFNHYVATFLYFDQKGHRLI